MSDVPEYELIEEAEMVYRALKRIGDWVSTPKIAEVLGWYNTEVVRNRLKRLMREGRVEKKKVQIGSRAVCLWKAVR